MHHREQGYSYEKISEELYKHRVILSGNAVRETLRRMMEGREEPMYRPQGMNDETHDTVRPYRTPSTCNDYWNSRALEYHNSRN